MRRRRRLEVTVETRRVIVRRGGNPDWCAECLAPVQTVTPVEAAALTGVTTGTVYRLAEAGRLHFVEPSARPPLICLNSLLRSTGEGTDVHAAEQAADPRDHD